MVILRDHEGLGASGPKISSKYQPKIYFVTTGQSVASYWLADSQAQKMPLD